MIVGSSFAGFQRVSVSRGVMGMVLTGILVSGTCWLSAADEAPAAGLRGILPAAVPTDLTATIAALPENWKDWSAAVSEELATLYEKEGLDVAGQRETIAKLRKRQKTAETHSADPRYRTIASPLVSLSGGLKRRLDVAEATLDTLERGPEIQAANLNTAGRTVAREAQALSDNLGRIKNGAGWVKYLQLNEARSAVGGGGGDAAATLAVVQTRLKGKSTLADDGARNFLSGSRFFAYENAVDAYLAAAVAPAAANSPELRKVLADLLGAIEQYEAVHSTAASSAVRKAFDAVRATSPDGGAGISQALRNNYLNYNLRISASEAFLTKVVGQARTECGPVDDCILGAKVDGTQTTVTSISVKLVPSSMGARFDIVAVGAVNSNTQGVTDQATIYTSGYHVFQANKQVIYDGQRFWTQPARIGVTAHNTTTGADTNFNLPIIRGFARRIAKSRAEDLRPEAEAIAASRVQDRVLPRFNAEVDREFGANGKTNAKVSERMSVLREQNLYPDAQSYSTTNTELKIATRVMASTELGGSEPNPALFYGRGATILVHESVMNNGADRLELAGQTLTDDQLKEKLEAHLTRLLGREVKFKDDQPAPADDSVPKTLVFDKSDPVRLQATDGALVLTLRTGFKQEGKEDIPTQIITIPMRFSVNVKNVVIEPGDISIAAAEPPESAAKQLARAGVIRKKMTTAFPRREIDRVRYLTSGNRRVLVAVTRIRAMDGWLSITVE